MKITPANWCRIRRIVFVFSLVATQARAQVRASPETLVQRIDADVWTILHRTETPGATILAVKDGRILYRHAYGFRTLDPRLPASTGTQYEIGSIAKQFTAAAILQLQAAHKLDIDARVSTYLPDAPHAAEITLRQLLTHASGLPGYLEASSEGQVAKQVTFQQLMSVIADKPLDSQPGSRASYSNTGYIMLGRIIEVTSHESYRQYVQSHLLKPARMAHTVIVADESRQRIDTFPPGGDREFPTVLTRALYPACDPRHGRRERTRPFVVSDVSPHSSGSSVPQEER